MNQIPIFVFHVGNPSYLNLMIMQAQKSENVVHLLGDDSNKGICDNWASVEDYVPKDYLYFEKIFVQMSDYPLAFDLNCFKRFFVMREYMQRNSIKKMIFADSDLMIFSNLSDFYHKNICGASLSIPKRQDNYRWTAQAHSSFWTIEHLSDFLDFVQCEYVNHIDVLTEKYKYHLKNSVKGGVCDMTLLYLWSLNKDDILNTAIVNNGMTFDHCIGEASNYLDNEFKYNRILRIKAVGFDDVGVYCTTINGQRVHMHTLHCQGAAKPMMAHIYNKNLNTFGAYKDRYLEGFNRIARKQK